MKAGRSHHLKRVVVVLEAREINPPPTPPSNALKDARDIFARERLEEQKRQHDAAQDQLHAEKEAEEQYSALLEDALRAVGCDIPPRPEIPSSRISATPLGSFIAEETSIPPSRI